MRDGVPRLEVRTVPSIAGAAYAALRAVRALEERGVSHPCGVRAKDVADYLNEQAQRQRPIGVPGKVERTRWQDVHEVLHSLAELGALHEAKRRRPRATPRFSTIGG